MEVLQGVWKSGKLLQEDTEGEKAVTALREAGQAKGKRWRSPIEMACSTSTTVVLKLKTFI